MRRHPPGRPGIAASRLWTAQAGRRLVAQGDRPRVGGERVLAVRLPLFAGASSHYSTAAATAPRLGLLDEAFAGVDDAARRQCMGLLSASTSTT